MKLHTIETGNFKLDGGAMFGVVPKSIWSRTNPADSNNMCTWAMRSLLIEVEDRLILIDTGIGDKQSEKFFSHFYLDHSNTLIGSIRKAGFSEDQITDVILTHLHFDHVGGAVKRNGGKLELTFKNAKYWSHQQHWNWAIHPNDREKASFLKENILPIEESGNLNFIEDKGHFENWIDFKIVSGHTECQLIPIINYQGKKIVFAADLLPSVGHIPLPYIMSYDMRPLLTLEEKREFLSEAEKENYYVFLQHDFYNEICTLKETEKGIRLDETYKSSELF